MRTLVILGAGGHGREVLDIVEAMNDQAPTYDFLGFLDDGPVDQSLLSARGAKVVGPINALMTLDAHYLIAIGDPAVRCRLDELATSWGRIGAVAVHPTASLGRYNAIGDGLVMAAGARATTNVSFGRHVHLNVNATVSHDCLLGDYVTLNPGAHVCGNCHIGRESTIGAGAVVKQGLTVGQATVVGAGAAVVTSFGDGITAVGVPARLAGS